MIGTIFKETRLLSEHRMIQTFLQPSFWFSLQPAEVGGWIGTSIFVIFLLMGIAGVVARIVAAQKLDDRYMRMMGNRFGTLLITMGMLGVVLYFFSFERIRLFGSRFWYLLWLIGLIVWIVLLVRYMKKNIPAMKEQAEARFEKRKYFPPRKKKRR